MWSKRELIVVVHVALFYYIIRVLVPYVEAIWLISLNFCTQTDLFPFKEFRQTQYHLSLNNNAAEESHVQSRHKKQTAALSGRWEWIRRVCLEQWLLAFAA